jgi:hypothetical protein
MPKTPSKSANKMVYQVLGLLTVLLALVAISTVATMVLTGAVEVGAVKSEPINFIADAEKMCDARVRDDYQGVLNSVTIDDRYSLFDKDLGRFKMFYQLEVYRDVTKRSGVKTIYMNCDVSARHGAISRGEYLDQELGEVNAKGTT